ncbi:hypothetical protein RvY_02745-2 [Ramazzottius varieornatus]|uniref:Uncharacterized protein n=1 Tax=Ramazzottius varieornatus TaxID=947166 RepID=A0A1D1UP73_RAMVA|nr:hypothetical protein RvY_02745-2 [Ramazzottius varieornatus]
MVSLHCRHCGRAGWGHQSSRQTPGGNRRRHLELIGEDLFKAVWARAQASFGSDDTPAFTDFRTFVQGYSRPLSSSPLRIRRRKEPLRRTIPTTVLPAHRTPYSWFLYQKRTVLQRYLAITTGQNRLLIEHVFPPTAISTC